MDNRKYCVSGLQTGPVVDQLGCTLVLNQNSVPGPFILAPSISTECESATRLHLPVPAPGA
ncbi:hypothetical protein BD777DRAFT_13066 [Yarrowia lipolytica]|nr:hypothetical protein BD777DRAFT_13066 [Yarrowia lipolytica]